MMLLFRFALGTPMGFSAGWYGVHGTRWALAVLIMSSTFYVVSWVADLDERGTG